MSGLIGPSAFIFGAISRDMTNRAKVSGRQVQRISAPTARCVAFEVPAVVRESEGGAVLRGPPNVQVPPPHGCSAASGQPAAGEAGVGDWSCLSPPWREHRTD